MQDARWNIGNFISVHQRAPVMAADAVRVEILDYILHGSTARKKWKIASGWSCIPDYLVGWGGEGFPQTPTQSAPPFSCLQHSPRRLGRCDQSSRLRCRTNRWSYGSKLITIRSRSFHIAETPVFDTDIHTPMPRKLLARASNETRVGKTCRKADFRQ